MSSPPVENSALSTSQRHCHLLLTLFLSASSTSLETLSQLNGVNPSVTQQDLIEVASAIQRYHRLKLTCCPAGLYRVEGEALDRRLCLVYWLRRALRLSPTFIKHHFAPAIRLQLQSSPIAPSLYDEIKLHQLLTQCALKLSREFSERDGQFLRLFMQHILCNRCCTPFTPSQRVWLTARIEHQVADEMMSQWWQDSGLISEPGDVLLFALLFSQMHIPSVDEAQHEHERALLHAVKELIVRFQSFSGMRFSNKEGICNQLYTHLAQAMERCLFGIGIDNTLTEEVGRLYPKLLRTTQKALAGFEQRYCLTFSPEEVGLITVIFGAWLMQESVLQEKQVLLLTDGNPALEQQIEQQLRELTLMPLNIKYLEVGEYQRSSAPKGISLVVTPYATPLPLYSPPLIHAELPLQPHQQQRIRQLLES
ncbi:stationary phase inducible protein CsiE [Erwinia tasmaniensis]|uniref:stationary phase inducible protein CsiE n=1 Tax=Erwinia tasmaniensis TaxID=338565 RepID=UPI003A4E0879